MIEKIYDWTGKPSDDVLEKMEFPPIYKHSLSKINYCKKFILFDWKTHFMKIIWKWLNEKEYNLFENLTDQIFVFNPDDWIKIN